jgi:hypothetical protein
MYKIEFAGENTKFNKIIWSIVAFIGSLKMGITSMEILFYENIEIINISRAIIWILVIIGISVLIYGLIKINKNKIPINEYKIGIKNNSIKIIGILCVYIILVFMPMFL